MATVNARRSSWSLKHLLPVVLMLGVGAVALRLGIWQLDRAEQKRVTAQARAEARAAEPIVIAQLEAQALLDAIGRHVVITVRHEATVPPIPQASTDVSQRSVLRASFPDARPTTPGPVAWYVDNRTHKTRPGVHVLAVLPLAKNRKEPAQSAENALSAESARSAESAQIAESAPNALSESADYVLLLRGWQPKDPQHPQGIRPGGKIGDGWKLIARVESPEEHRPSRFGRAVAGDQAWHWLGIDPEKMGEGSGASLLPVVLRQLDDARDPQGRRVDDGLVREWSEPADGIEKHNAYAFQWFSLAALGVLIAAILGWRGLRRAEA